jgi:hypothetical protein
MPGLDEDTTAKVGRNWRTVVHTLALNGAPQPPRATDIRHETESSSRGWLQVFVR